MRADARDSSSTAVDECGVNRSDTALWRRICAHPRLRPPRPRPNPCQKRADGRVRSCMVRCCRDRWDLRMSEPVLATVARRGASGDTCIIAPTTLALRSRDPGATFISAFHRNHPDPKATRFQNYSQQAAASTQLGCRHAGQTVQLVDAARAVNPSPLLLPLFSSSARRHSGTEESRGNIFIEIRSRRPARA